MPKIIYIAPGFAACLFLLVLGFGVNHGFFTSSGEQIAINHEDDSCYYLEIAKNISNGNFFTFDGVNKTNGFHPVWAF